jgi:hypothetical protein
MRTALRWLYFIIFLLPFSLVIGIINVRLYYTKTNLEHSDVVTQLAFIKERLHKGAGEEMQQFFPEGYFFTHVLYGLTWVDVGLKNPSRIEQAITEARWALKQLESPQGRYIFSAELTPAYGVFYAGWTSWLRGGLLKLQVPDKRDTDEIERFTSELTTLAAAFDTSETPFLQAYPNLAWPVDSTVAVAALHLHDTLFPPQFEATIARWITLTKNKLDPATGLLPHEVNRWTGDLIQGTRGSSQSVIQRFLPEIDAAWAAEAYPKFRAQFVDTVLGVPGVREYPKGVEGTGDVDSGPLLAWMSLSASVVTVAAAKVEGDSELANAMLNVGEALGMPIESGGRKRYALGVLPTGDAFLAWAKSATPWTFTPAPMSLPEVPVTWWRWPIQAVTVLMVVMLWWLFLRRRQRHSCDLMAAAAV